MATDGFSFNDQPFFRNGNLHLDRPCGLHLFGAWRVERFDSGNHAALQIAFRNLLRLLRRGRGDWGRRRWRLNQFVSHGGDGWRWRRPVSGLAGREGSYRGCSYHWRIDDSITRVRRGTVIRKAVRRAQHLRQVAQPADCVELFVLFNDSAEEGRFSVQAFFERPDADRDEYSASIRKAGVDFGAGGQIGHRFSSSVDT